MQRKNKNTIVFPKQRRVMDRRRCIRLIEFDHQTSVALPGPKVPGRVHAHSVVRTPNGNDYGKDLL
jgi:hypothetical protein